jgi:crotonobetainyl-CoA:carnitine CoA-transferase CaiB-like acyl-CoA transferase
MLSAAGVAASQLYDARLIPQHEQLISRCYFERLTHPVVGEHRVPTIPLRFSSVDKWCRSPAPTVGQDNESVLKEWLGVDDAAIEELASERVIGSRPVGVD